jgi:hypothetical protein
MNAKAAKLAKHFDQPVFAVLAVFAFLVREEGVQPWDSP